VINFKELKLKYDNKNMFDAILSFPNQIKFSLDYMRDWQPKNEYNHIETILISGMGGSAIGGDFVASLCNQYCNIPIIVNRSYEIPNWVNKNTLIISSSYSGNTDETLNALNLAIEKSATVVAVTTGGKLLKVAKNNLFDFIKVTPGYQPRAALGFSIALNLLLLEKIKLIPKNLMTNLLKNSLNKLTELSLIYSDYSNTNNAIEFSKKIYNKFPVIYASEGWQANCAFRMRGQLAENAKILSSHLSFPEQNHNEIEGWNNNKILKETVICWIMDNSDHPQVEKRMQITKELLSKYPINHLILRLECDSNIERALCMIHLIDWISFYCALLNNIDPTPVVRITELKNRLSDE
tara:strand:- start:1234 stop:2289 length:1056 start_codon:yes stop_codon:yes gene_type:complete